MEPLAWNLRCVTGSLWILFEVQRCSTSCVAHANSVFWRFVVCMRLTRQNSNQGMQPCSQCKCANIWPAFKRRWCDRVCAFRSPESSHTLPAGSHIKQRLMIHPLYSATFRKHLSFTVIVSDWNWREFRRLEAVLDKMAFSWSFLSLNFSPLFFFFFLIRDRCETL